MGLIVKYNKENNIIHSFNSVREIYFHDMTENGYKSQTLIISAKESGSPNSRYNVIRIFLFSGRCRNIGRELDIYSAREVAKRSHKLDGTFLYESAKRERKKWLRRWEKERERAV